MTRKILAFLLAFLTAGSVAWYVSSKLFRPPAKVTPPEVPEIKPREAVDVPDVKFTDVTAESGIKFRHVNGATAFKLLPETMGGGVAVFDYDGDGDQDVLFVQSGWLPGHTEAGSPPTMALYRNLGGFKFEDVTSAVGLSVPMYGMGVCVGDIDNDGHPDVFVSCVGRHRLFRNVGGTRFEDISAKAGVAGGPDLPEVNRAAFGEWAQPIPFGASSTFLDYDGDGRLDLFVCHYVEWSPKFDRSIGATLSGVGRAYVPPRDFNGAQCALYRNIDGTRFEDVSNEAGVKVFRPDGVGPNARPRAVGKCLGVVLCDPDDDGWPDVMVANDGTPNFFFHNEAAPGGKRRFKECAAACGAALAEDATARGGMGIDYAEYLPGSFAAVIANFANEPNTFLRLRTAKPGQLFFSDVAVANDLAGPSRSPLKFGAFFFDYDLDGRLDLLTCNGHLEPEINKVQPGQTFAQPAQLYWNTGRERPLFEPVTAATTGPGMFQPIVGRGSAYGDLDGDGDLDVILCANDGPPLVLRNDNNLKHHFVRLRLTGDGMTSNRSAIGAKITLQTGDLRLTRTVVGARGYLSQSESPVTIGLGATNKVDQVTVRWPGGGVETFDVPGINRVVDLKQGTAKQTK
jgi:enediyne biosynthesis protein E4